MIKARTGLIIMLASVLVLSFSCGNKGKQQVNPKAEWIEKAFKVLTDNEFPRIKAISWWHENFDGSSLRIDSSEESLQAYRQGACDSLFITEPVFVNDKLIPSELGIYHAAFPDFGGTEDVVTQNRISSFESIASKDIAWAYFSNNWYDEITFPMDAVNTILTADRTPFIRMMPRSNFDEGGPDPIYTMQAIIDGQFDDELTLWATAASSVTEPLLVEFGTEVNGSWFPWNGQFNGGGTSDQYGDSSLPDGPERFRDAYRHIIDICDGQGANNITWFFHINAYGQPEATWNDLENYYPGDDYIDWLGVSVYGPQTFGEDDQQFAEILGDVYPSLVSLSDHPIAILEFAITEL